MEKKGFTKISYEKSAEIYGGSMLIFLGTLLPMILQSVTSVVSSFKLLFSDKGEVKSKDGTLTKWEKFEDKSNPLTKVTFIN